MTDLSSKTALMLVDIAKLGTVHSLFDLIGHPVVDEAGRELGTIEDLLAEGARVSHAVLSVGGVLGLGAHHVVIDFADLSLDNDDHVILPGASRETLSGLTEYGSTAGAKVRRRQGRRGVKDAGQIVTTAMGEPLVGVIADISDGDR